jgi:putative endonuclease
MNLKPWSVYIVKCRDGKFYTGISNDVENRVRAHNKGKGCRFTRFRYPVKLAYQEECGTRSAARKRELEIQRFSRRKKLDIINKATSAL